MGTKYLKNISCPSAMIRKCNRNTQERQTAEVYGGTEIAQDHAKQTSPGFLQRCWFTQAGGKESQLNPFILVQLILLVAQGLGRTFLQLSFCSLREPVPKHQHQPLLQLTGLGCPCPPGPPGCPQQGLCQHSSAKEILTVGFRPVVAVD